MKKITITYLKKRQSKTRKTWQLLFFLLSLFFANQVSFAQYCTPAFVEGCGSGDVINSFEIPTASFSHPNTGCSAGAYGNFTSMTISLHAGIPYNYSTTHGYGSQKIRIWIDFDENEAFDDTTSSIERVSIATNTFSGTGFNTVNGTILIPSSVTPGTYRMRVATRFSSQPIPCNTAGYGEAHDYLVEVLPPPTCDAPTALTALNSTADSSELQWDSDGTLFDIEWGELGFTPGNGTIVNGINSTSYALSQLEGNTNYQFYVRQDCGGGDLSLWSGPHAFKTACIAFGDFTQGFETTPTSTVMPDCWSRKIVSNQTGPYVYTSTSDVNTGSRALRLGNSGDTNAQLYAITPPLTDLPMGTHRLKFFAKGSTFVTLEVGTMTDPSDQSTFTGIQTFPLTENHQSFTLNFDTIGTDSYIAFKATYTGTYYFVSIDDVIWEPLPECADVFNLSYENITTNEATINWETSGSETAWQYALGYSTDTDPDTLATVNVTGGNPTAAVDGLDPSTVYKIWVRSDCGAGAYGIWVGPISFKTACEAFGDFTEGFETTPTSTVMPDCWSRKIVSNQTGPYVYTSTSDVNTGSRALRLGNSGDTNAQLYAITPPLTDLAMGTHRLKFFAKGSTFVTLEVGTMTDPSNQATFTGIQTFPLTTNHQSFTLNFDTVSTDSYIAFKATYAGTYYFVSIDDVIWEPLPECADVFNLSHTNVTSNEATLNWETSGSETAWQYALGYSTDTDPDTLATVDVTGGNPTAAVNALDPSTAYKVWVRSYCGAGTYGAWAGPISFTTACEAFDSPFLQEFSNGVIPECWKTTSSNPVPNGLWKFTGAVDYAAGHGRPNGTFAWVDGSDPSTINNVTLTSPIIDLSSLIDPQLSFDYFSNSGNTAYPNNIFSVEVFDGSDWTEVYTNNTNSNQWRIIDVSLAQYAGTSIQVRFIVDKTPPAVGYAFYNDILLDNVTIDNAPTCKVPTDLTYSDLTSNSVVLNWEPSDSNPSLGYEYAYSTTNQISDALSGTVTAGVTTASIGDLDSATQYYAWVRAVCLTTDSSTWVGPIPFKTACDYFGDFTEGFETTPTATVMPDCWSRKIVSNQTGPYVYISTSDANTGSRALRLGNSGDTNAQLYAITPPLTDLPMGTHRMKFFAKGSTFVTLEVGTMTDPSDQSTFTGIQTFPLTANHQSFNLDFDTVGTDSYIAFKATYTGTYYFVSIDDVIWEPIPECADVFGLIPENITPNEATINWETNGSESAWQYVVGNPTDTNPSTLTALDINTTTLDLIDLDPSTTYKIWVRSNCGSGSFGAWIGPLTFTTSILNDECSGAVALTIGGQFADYAIQGSNIGATKNAADPVPTDLCDGFNFATNGKDVWFSIEVPSSGSVTIETGAVTGSSLTDTGLEIYSGACGAMAFVACNADISTTAPINRFSRVVLNNRTPGEILLVRVFGYNGTSGTFMVSAFDASLENPSFENNTFKVYPNPVKDILNLSYNQTISNVEIFNMLGQQVITKNLNAPQGQIDMSNLASGTYLVKVVSDNVSKTYKVLKQ